MTAVTAGDSIRDGGVGGWRQRPLREIMVSSTRICLVLLWATWAALAWWASPRPVDVEQARADIAAGRVSSFVRGGVWEAPGSFRGLLPPSPRLKADGALLVWTTPNGQVRYTAPQISAAPEGMIGAGGSGDSGLTGQLAAELSAAQSRATPPTVDHATLVSIVRIMAVVLVLVSFAILVAGPIPRRGTRFFWFWVGWVPFGLGILAWLATEHPWARRLAAEPVPKKRWDGFHGILLAAAAGIVIGFAIQGLRRLLGPWVVPG